MVAIIIGNVKLLLCPDLSLDQEQGQDACVLMSRGSRMQRMETDSEILHVVLIRQTVSKEGEKPARRVREFYGSFHKRASLCPRYPTRPRESCYQPLCILYNARAVLWWLSSCNKTKFHFIYFLWCTQLHSENNYSSIINLKNIVQTKQFLQYLHTKEEFCEMICEGLQHIASIVALIVSNLTRVSRSLWIDQGRCIDDLSHPSCKFTRKPCEN